MIKNKAVKALIIGTCLTVTSIAGVYADETTVAMPEPAVVMEETVDPEAAALMATSGMAQTDDALTQKQQEIDKLVFEKHIDELDKQGIIVTSTVVAGSNVEVAISPYSEEKANYLYDLLGKDAIKVVEGPDSQTFEMTITSVDNNVEVDKEVQTVSAPQEERSLFGKIINNIVEWFKSIF